MVNGEVKDTKKAAEGLLGPAIAELEEYEIRWNNLQRVNEQNLVSLLNANKRFRKAENNDF